MITPVCERVVTDALRCGRGILKFISPNDVGQTGSHQCGYYLPVRAWKLYSPHPPDDGVNAESEVRIIWQDGRETSSRIKWYGKGTRHEFRLTRFGRDFPWLKADNIGNLLILIPEKSSEFQGYVLDTEEDIEFLEESLGIEFVNNWAVYDPENIVGMGTAEENEELCIQRWFNRNVSHLTDFPSTSDLSNMAWDVIGECIRGYMSCSLDNQLIKARDIEYELFKEVERTYCRRMINKAFDSVDDFLKAASSIMNRRKARSGRSLEYIVRRILINSGLRRMSILSFNRILMESRILFSKYQAITIPHIRIQELWYWL